MVLYDVFIDNLDLTEQDDLMINLHEKNIIIPILDFDEQIQIKKQKKLTLYDIVGFLRESFYQKHILLNLFLIVHIVERICGLHIHYKNICDYELMYHHTHRLI